MTAPVTASGRQPAARYEMGVDVGGTFTDLVLVDAAGSVVGTHKLLTSPDDPARSVVSGVRELLSDLGLDRSDLRRVVHGTTLATNALIERKGAPTALLTTCGFRDLLEMGSEQRYDIHDLFLRLPEPLVPRSARLEVRERLSAAGAEIESLDEEGVRAHARALSRSGVTCVAIVFLHSYANPAHERRAEELLREEAPELVVVPSWRVVPEIREYERASTTVANAYLLPVVGRYLSSLEQQLAPGGAGPRLYLMQSDGGSVTAEVAAELPIRILESGPAAGTLVAADDAARARIPRLLSFDMGGTTAKVCLISDGRPSRVPSLEVARLERFKPGSGLPIRAPAIDLLEVGGGGGSIARVDRLGLLKVGPDSAGADPGPACYPTNAETDPRPTVTDAVVALGYVGVDAFLGGRMALDAQRAARAIERHVAAPLGLSLEGAAWGIHSVVVESMAAAVRVHCIEHAVDPRSCVLFAFGGAGPLHAVRIAAALGISRVVCPPRSGVASAVGLLVAPLSFTESRSMPAQLLDVDVASADLALREMAEAASGRLRGAGVPARRVRLEAEADCSLVGQSHELSIEVPAARLRRSGLADLAASFRRTYQRRYGHPAPDDAPVQVLTWRVTATEARDRRPRPIRRTGKVETPRPRLRRPAYFAERKGFVATPIYVRAELVPGAGLTGPAMVEEDASTTVVPPGWRLRVGAGGELDLSRSGGR